MLSPPCRAAAFHGSNMAELICAVSGLTPEVKADVLRAIEQLGLHRCANPRTATRPISSPTLSRRPSTGRPCERAASCVGGEWALRSAELHGALEPEDQYLLPPLHGLHIVASDGFRHAEVRAESHAPVQRLGGTYSGALTHECTHLIVETPQGEKFRSCASPALSHIQVVSCGWLDECARTGVKADEAPFLMLSREPCLSACVVHVARKSASEEQLRPRARRALGATRVERVGPMVTHVLLGDSACANPLRWSGEVSETTIGGAPNAVASQTLPNPSRTPPMTLRGMASRLGR